MEFTIEVLDGFTDTWVPIIHGIGTMDDIEKALNWARTQTGWYCRVIIT